MALVMVNYDALFTVSAFEMALPKGIMSLPMIIFM
jgi:hypothetical protein